MLLAYAASPFQGMSMPIAHVEESWQMAEFYNNKVLLIIAANWQLSLEYGTLVTRMWSLYIEPEGQRKGTLLLLRYSHIDICLLILL